MSHLVFLGQFGIVCILLYHVVRCIHMLYEDAVMAFFAWRKRKQVALSELAKRVRKQAMNELCLAIPGLQQDSDANITNPGILPKMLFNIRADKKSSFPKLAKELGRVEAEAAAEHFQGVPLLMVQTIDTGEAPYVVLPWSKMICMLQEHAFLKCQNEQLRAQVMQLAQVEQIYRVERN